MHKPYIVGTFLYYDNLWLNKMYLKFLFCNLIWRYRRAAEGASENKSDAEFLNNVFAAGNKNGRAMMYSKTPAELILPTGNKYILAKDNYTEVRFACNWNNKY